MGGKEILQLKNNCIPKGLVHLKKLFDNNHIAKNPKVIPNDNEVQYCNIGNDENPRIIKLSKSLSLDSRRKYISLMKQFPYVFAWTYDDLKVYDTNIIKHIIPVKENEKTFKQKLRRLKPLLLPLIEKEVNKLFDAKIIVSLRFSKWLENLVPLKKKNGEIRLCVDFRNLNKVSLKDNYPFSQNGPYFAKSCWISKDVNVGWFFRIQSDYGSSR